MKLQEFDYNLPPELIAQSPVTPRDHSRLLVLDKATGTIEHRHFFDVVDYLNSGDILVVNDSKVFPARLFGHKEDTGGKVEIFLNHETSPGVWEAIGRNLKIGHNVGFNNSPLIAEIVQKNEEIYTIKFNLIGEEFFDEIEKFGTIPLPPYIKREEGVVNDDKERYQTVYAGEKGSAAAPTAGLHFTPEILSKITAKNIKILKVTLHVGLGTFAPVKAENIEDHNIHSEFYSVKPEVIDEIINAKKSNHRIIAVGTTSTRVLEHVFRNPRTSSGSSLLSGWTKIFIYPGYEFHCIDGLITNFHLPKSSLLMLVSALAGPNNIKHSYSAAVSEKYRFFSYGDAMLII